MFGPYKPYGRARIVRSRPSLCYPIGGGGVQVPSAPVLSLSSYTDTTIDVSCTSIPGATGYKFYRDGTLVATQAGTTYQYTGLTPVTSYALTCKAYNGAGDSGSSNTVTQRTFYPTITSSLLWLDRSRLIYSDTGGTTPAVTDGAIARWDAPGTNWGTLSFVQATAANQPTLKSDGLQCDGTNDFLQAASTISLTGDFTVYIAHYIAATTNLMACLTKQGAGSYFHMLAPSFSDGKAYVASASAGDSWAAIGTAASRITRFRRSGTTLYMQTYGQAEAASTSGGVFGNTITLDAVLGRGGSNAAYSNSAGRLKQVVVVGANITPGNSSDLAILAAIAALEPGINYW